MNNPFYKSYNTQFEIPPFSEIEEKHYMPAFLKGMEEHNSEINEIIQNLEKPTFNNVIIAMERSGDILNRVSNVFFNLSGSATNIKLQEIEKEISPLLSEHYDSISLNPDIFNKIKLPVCILNIGGISNITIVKKPVGSLEFFSKDKK